FLDSPTERRARKRRCIAGGYLEGMPIPARSIPTRVGAESLSTGTSTELDTHGRVAALRAPTLIREDRTQRGKCCVSSSSIHSHSRLVRVSPFMALLRHGWIAIERRLSGQKQTLERTDIPYHSYTKRDVC